MRIILFPSLLSIIVLLGCGSKPAIQSNNAKALYEDTINELSKEDEGFPWIFSSIDYELVEEQLKEIQIRYTYSPYATLAELRTADVYFKKKEYKQAAIEYEEFIKRHPSHNGAQYAMYFLALSNYYLIKGHDRSPKSAWETIEWFDKYEYQYPDTPLSNNANSKIQETKEVLAKREIYIGKFYARKKNHRAAVARYKNVAIEYPDTSYLAEALYLMGKSYIQLKENELAVSALNRIITEFPASKYNDDAKNLLSSIK